jgi:hypothetical protein
MGFQGIGNWLVETPVVTPEPSSIGLFGSGALLLAFCSIAISSRRLLLDCLFQAEPWRREETRWRAAQDQFEILTTLEY